MNYDDVRAIIINSPLEHWQGVNGPNNVSVHFYRPDVALRFEIHYGDDDRCIQSKNFVEPWANGFPDPKATGYFTELHYGATFLEHVLLVAVDGGRALIPPPQDVSTGVIPMFNHKVGLIHDSSCTLGDYIARAGLSVER